MLTLPPDDLLPVLVVDLDDVEARTILDAAAATGRRVWVPLDTAPVSADQHLLEVHTPGTEPFFYIAVALGPPTVDGFPLRLRPTGDAQPASKKAAEKKAAETERAIVRGRRSQSSLSLSESHTKDLSHVGPMPTEDSDPKIGQALAGGKLLIEQVIGRGGVGVVYRARHRELKMAVAVKVLHESFQADIDFCRRFYAEALAASRLDHPNITRVIDFGQEPDGRLYFAMEFLDGLELRAVLDKERKLGSARIASIMMQVCAGLSHAHARGIVHRDIKPENLVLVPGHDDDGKPIEIVKVCDFGIALHRAQPSTDIEGIVAGTPEYMSPEQCRGAQLDARSDIYACGVILYELATGQCPFIGETVGSVIDKQLFASPLKPSLIEPSVDPMLEEIILTALAKDPAGRQPTMRDLRAQLRKLLDPVLLEATPPSVREVAAAEEAPAESQFDPIVQSNAILLEVDEVDTLAADAVAFAGRLAKAADPKVFANGIQKLEPALRTLAARGDVDPLWTIASAMHAIAMEGGGAVGTRAWCAAKLLRVFEDPTLLVQIAEQYLAGPAELREKARRILLHAGVAGAHGLYGGRVKLARNAAIRAPFIAVLKDFGPKAWPVVRASLEKIAVTKGPNAATLELAEDLLLCVALVGDESAGHLVLKFLRSTHSGVCRAATAAIIKLWNERAKPVLVAMVQSKEDVIRVAGIAGLRQLGAIDEHLVPRLHAILTRRVPASEEVRAAAAVALGHASEPARRPAVSLLAQLVTLPRGTVPARVDPQAPPSSLTKQDAVLVAMARSLLTIGGRPYREVVAERAEQSPEPLRGQLRGLLTAV